MDQYIEDEMLNRFSEWQEALERTFMYKKPFFINSNEVKCKNFQEVYVMPVFAKSGRQTFVI